MDVYAQGPGAARLQDVTSLEDLLQEIQSIVRPKPKSNEPASGGMDELTAVETPKKKQDERRVLMHVTRVRGVRCSDRKCFLPAKRALRRGNPEEWKSRIHDFTKDSEDFSEGKKENSDPTEDRKEMSTLQGFLKKKRHSPDYLWGLLDEIRRPRSAPLSLSAEPANALPGAAVIKYPVEQTEITAGDKEKKILEIEKKSGEVSDLSDIKEKDDVRSKQKRDIHSENQTAQKTLTSDETTQEPVGKSASGTDGERVGLVDVASTKKIHAPEITPNSGKMKVANDVTQNKDKGANRPEETTTATNKTDGRATEKSKETVITVDASKIEERGTKNVTAENYNQRSKPTSVDNKTLQIARDASGKVIASTLMAGSAAKLIKYGVYDDEQGRDGADGDPKSPGDTDPPQQPGDTKPPGDSAGGAGPSPAQSNKPGGNASDSGNTTSSTKGPDEGKQSGEGAGGAPSSPVLALALSITLLLLLHG